MTEKLFRVEKMALFRQGIFELILNIKFTTDNYCIITQCIFQKSQIPGLPCNT